MSAYVTFLTWTKLVLLVVALSAVYSTVQCCSTTPTNEEEINIGHKAENSAIVLTAKVLKTRPDTRFPDNNVYYADLEVKCIYKGEQVNELITVAEAGSAPGLCLSTNLIEFQSYILYMRSDGGLFIQQFSPDPDDEQHIDEITALCNLYLHYPKGYNATNKKYDCTNVDVDELDCVVETTPQLVTSKSEEKTGPKPTPETTPDKNVEYNKVRSNPNDESSGQTLFLCWSSIISLIGAMFLL